MIKMSNNKSLEILRLLNLQNSKPNNRNLKQKLEQAQKVRRAWLMENNVNAHLALSRLSESWALDSLMQQDLTNSA
jgi:hypothetical protein